jgi:hypothetical protein
VCYSTRLFSIGASAAAQAKLFASTVGAFGPGDLAVLDLEVTDNQKPADVAQWAHDFVGNVMSLTGLPASRVLGTVPIGKNIY